MSSGASLISIYRCASQTALWNQIVRSMSFWEITNRGNHRKQKKLVHSHLWHEWNSVLSWWNKPSARMQECKHPTLPVHTMKVNRLANSDKKASANSIISLIIHPLQRPHRVQTGQRSYDPQSQMNLTVRPWHPVSASRLPQSHSCPATHTINMFMSLKMEKLVSTIIYKEQLQVFSMKAQGLAL